MPITQTGNGLANNGGSGSSVNWGQAAGQAAGQLDGLGDMSGSDLGGNVGQLVWSATANAFAPGSGQFAGQIGKWFGSTVGGIFGGGSNKGTNEFDGLHDTRFAQLAASTYGPGEVRILTGYAVAASMGVEAVLKLMETDSSVNGHSIASIFDSWQNGYTPDLANLRKWLRIYNQMNGGVPIREGDLSTYQPAARPTAPPTRTSSAPAQQFQINGQASNFNAGNVLRGAYDGAVKGATDAAMDSPEGRKAQDEGAIAFIQRRWYIPAAIVSLIVGLVVALVSKRK